MVIRNISNTDIDRIISVWNASLPHEVIDKRAFIKKLLLDPNFQREGFFIVEEDGEIQGFVNCPFLHQSSETVGFISILAIKERARVEEIGNILLSEAEKYLLGHGKRYISTGYAPIYFTQGVDKDLCPEYVKLYRSRGYSEKESYRRVKDLSQYVYPEKCKEKKKALEQEGFYIGEIRDEYILSLINPDAPFSHSPSWNFEFKSRLSDLDYGRIRIASKDGEIVGCVVFGDPNGSPERFGPFGVSECMRGKGLGTLLLHECFLEMKKRGLQSTWAQWTPTQGPASILYDHYGFVKKNSYLLFEKNFDKI